MKLVGKEIIQKNAKNKKILVTYDLDTYIEAHFKTKLTLLSSTNPLSKKRKRSSVSQKKISTLMNQTRIPLPPTSFRSKMIKKTFITQKHTIAKQKTNLNLNLKQVSLSKFSKVSPQKNVLTPQKSIRNKMKRMTTTQNKNPLTHTEKPKKNKIETNLYVDVASLNYEKLVEIINLEIETDAKKDLNYRKIYLKIKVNFKIYLLFILFLKENDLKTKKKENEVWSGENVIPTFTFTKKRIISLFRSLNETAKNIKFYKSKLMILKVLIFILKADFQFLGEKSAEKNQKICAF